MKNIIHNVDCIDFLEKSQSGIVDVVLTSPFYNTARPRKSEKMFAQFNKRYDVHIDDMTDQEYIDYSVKLFGLYDKVLKKNGVVLYNLSYSAEKPSLMWLVVAEIVKQTNFDIADTIVWKKNNAIPNNMSSNRMTRIVEYVFVFCRKTESKTFKTNKKVVSERANGQKNYEFITNFVEARNNDGKNHLNNATYSTELCEKLLGIYAQPGSVVFDSFMGTGTTAVAAVRLGHDFIGCEISQKQCEYAESRLEKERNLFSKIL